MTQVASSSCAKIIEAYVDEVMHYGQNWNIILDALEESTKNINIKVYVLCCDLYIALEDGAKAIEHLNRAKNLITTQETEQIDILYVEAWDLWLSGSLQESYAKFYQILSSQPTDMLALKRGQLLAFLSGNAQAMVDIATIPQVVAASSGKKYYHGCLSFALEQVGIDLEMAEIEARRGLQIMEADAWAQHALAHILYFTGRLHEGLTLLLKFSPQWQHLMSFLYTHNWFHVALFQLDLDLFDDVVHTWDARLWKTQSTADKIDKKITTFPLMDSTNSQDQLGAAGLLWKLELRLVRRAFILNLCSPDLDERWKSIANAIRLPTTHWDPLFDVIVTHTLLRAQRKEDAQIHVDATKAAIATQPEPRRSQLDSVLSPILDAILSFGNAANTTVGKASTILHPFVRDRQRAADIRFLGGSSEQRAVLHEFILEVMLAEEQWDDAITEVSAHLDARPAIAHSSLLLGFAAAQRSTRLIK